MYFTALTLYWCSCKIQMCGLFLFSVAEILPCILFQIRVNEGLLARDLIYFSLSSWYLLPDMLFLLGGCYYPAKSGILQSPSCVCLFVCLFVC